MVKVLAMPANKRYNDLNTYLRNIFGCRVQKITVDAQRDVAIEDRASQNRIREMMLELSNEMKLIQANLDSAVTIENTQANADMTSNTQEHQYTMREIAAQQRNLNG